jgi:hypothetical protein
MIDLEIASVNISVEHPGGGEVVDKSTEIQGDPIPVTKWHFDSYPFVVVLMMSDASNMVGGETAIKTPSGEIIKVRGPQMVICEPSFFISSLGLHYARDVLSSFKAGASVIKHSLPMVAPSVSQQ